MSRRKPRAKRSSSPIASSRTAADRSAANSGPRVIAFAKRWKWPMAALVGLFVVSVLVSSAPQQQKPAPPDNRPRQSPAAAYRSMLAADPSNDQAHYNLGRVLQSQGKQAKAIAHYQQAISIRDNDAKYHNNLAAALAGQGQFEKSIEHFNIALTLEPTNIQARFNLGNASYSSGKIEDAIQHFRAVIALKPDHSRAHNNLAVAFKKSGLLQEAYQHRYEAMRLERAQQGVQELP